MPVRSPRQFSEIAANSGPSPDRTIPDSRGFPPGYQCVCGDSSGGGRAPPGIGIRLVDVPVATADDPRARAYIIDHVAPGTVIKRRVQVSNGTDTTSRISMYPAAAEIRGGTFTGDGRTKNELSSWISLKPRSPLLGPQKRTFVNVSITVPGQASRGERYGVVWAEMTSTSEGGGVTQVSRVGVRIYLSVGPGGAPPSDFSITSLTAARNAEGTPPPSCERRKHWPASARPERKAQPERRARRDLSRPVHLRQCKHSRCWRHRASDGGT